MFSLLKIPGQVIGILEANISPGEIAAGVCLGMFLGLIPLNGPMALLLAVFFFVFRINRAATLLTLPLFKSVYLFGMSGVAEKAGYYLLAGIPSLAGFWGIVIHLPVVAYLDLNNTLVAGGIAIASVFTVPAYFLSKQTASFVQAKYAMKIKGTKYGKIASGLRVASAIAGTDTDEILSNVKSEVKTTVVTKVKSAVLKPKTVKGGILGRIQVVKIAVIIIVLAVINFGIGAYFSPAATSFVVGEINRYTPAKISIGKANIWPLTLACSLEDLRIFDPENESVRIAKIDKASIRVSLLGLLSKRLVFSHIHAKGAEINITGSSDESFNVSRLASQKAGAEGERAVGSAWGFFTEKRDLFGKLYGMIRKRFSVKGRDEAAASRQAGKKVVTTTTELPKGRVVKFKARKDDYAFEIRDLTIDDAFVGVTYNGDKIDVKNARLRLGRAAYDEHNGMRLDIFGLKGDVVKVGVPAGECDIFFSKSFDKNGQNATVNISLKNIDLDAVRFIYEDSLPVGVDKGKLTLSSRTHIERDRIDSRNNVNLTQHVLKPKPGGVQSIGMLPVASIMDALNSIDPVHLRFEIKGTVDKPEFGGFQESLIGLVKPYLSNVTRKLQEEGVKALGSFLDKIANRKKEGD